MLEPDEERQEVVDGVEEDRRDGDQVDGLHPSPLRRCETVIHTEIDEAPQPMGHRWRLSTEGLGKGSCTAPRSGIPPGRRLDVSLIEAIRCLLPATWVGIGNERRDRVLKAV